ncbi:hypothetical protein BJY59DRAFT_692986 [Rhodotorula toruloides]
MVAQLPLELWSRVLKESQVPLSMATESRAGADPLSLGLVAVSFRTLARPSSTCGTRSSRADRSPGDTFLPSSHSSSSTSTLSRRLSRATSSKLLIPASTRGRSFNHDRVVLQPTTTKHSRGSPLASSTSQPTPANRRAVGRSGSPTRFAPALSPTEISARPRTRSNATVSG